ncbi:deoxyguanosine kinase [Ligilactobacillus acidipiscis DSM 15836]|uniref:Deoxyguanosine kinase n=2 Tax=Ligilactobacillus acidipiscis TaxID=89059 RepID=A0A0R2K8P2_9LACO|nr:deoxynucleoside kinase [Ligilactobacillus acidipiscis]KRM25305.1 deoxyguanosine kinase [Ligilactobacillus acidipiscis DSM 15836]KRN83701.1 deoxyguanosine kinase [Ligilactobacillus acidipiscis]MCI1923979.1 deoxynucleoside kinase [Ligilactobacillus acidipiscis]MCI1953555.1 deoxynucleoside kinase [Ligilactobacillus acidipiscis]WEV56700.1 deoxynucleoside kinase [Ligilactobacillus acidipiscis]
MITLSGIIGSGKSSLTDILSAELGTKAYYEPVQDNPVLPIFYKGNEIAAQKRAAGDKEATNPYAYLLQTFFLNRRFSMIKAAMREDNNILDRSIYEDEIFMKINTEMGNATQVEYDIYKSLLNNMMEELPFASHKKSPDLMITIKVSYETMLKRIEKRGRDYELVEKDPSLEDYYHRLLNCYEVWMKEYKASPLLVIDGDKYDFVDSLSDRVEVFDMIESKLHELGNLNDVQMDKFKAEHEKIFKAQ